MTLYHRFDCLTDTHGNSLAGFQVIVRLANAGAQQSLFGDLNGTPIITYSGIADTAVTDDAGNFSYFVQPSSVYDEEYYSPTGVFQFATRNIPMQAGIQGLAGNDGATGPANSTYASLASLKAAPASNLSYYLSTPSGLATYAYIAGDFTGKDDEQLVVQLDGIPLTTGALVQISNGGLSLPFNLFAVSETNRTAQQIISPVDIGTHPGILHAGFGIEFRPTGSGLNGPGNADIGFAVSAIKVSDNVGEMDLVYLVGQQSGVGSDICAVLADIAHKGGTGFSANWEGVTKNLDPNTGNIVSAVRVQYATIDTAAGGSIGYYASAQAGNISVGLLLSSNPGIFTNYITCAYGGSSFPVFNVDGQGVTTIRKGGLGDGAGIQQIGLHFASSGGNGSVGNTLEVAEEFYNYTTAGDWRTTAWRMRYSIDGSLSRGISPYIGFRGRPDTTAEIIFGFGSDGPAVSIPPTGGMFIAPITADPSTPPAGSIWYNSSSDKWNFQKASTTATL